MKITPRNSNNITHTHIAAQVELLPHSHTAHASYHRQHCAVVLPQMRAQLAGLSELGQLYKLPPHPAQGRVCPRVGCELLQRAGCAQGPVFELAGLGCPPGPGTQLRAHLHTASIESKHGPQKAGGARQARRSRRTFPATPHLDLHYCAVHQRLQRAQVLDVQHAQDGGGQV